MVEGYGNLNGTGPQQVWVNNVRQSQSQGGNSSTFRVQLVYVANNYGSWSNSTQYWSLDVGSPGATKHYEGSFTIPSPGKSNITLLDTTYTKSHDSNGNLGAFNVTGNIATDHSSIGDGSVTVTEPASPRIPKAPATPAKPTVTNPATTSLQVNYVAPNNNGSAITGYEVDYSKSSTMASGVTTVNDSASPLVVTGLDPGTAYYFRVRAKNAVGESASSAIATGTTLPAVPPGLVVATSASGTSATLTFSPPGGVTGVAKYKWSRRATGTTSPVTTGETTTTVATVTGLVPGNSYDWSATAFIGDYESPAVDPWITLKQAKPNTSPGDYFDGSTTDSADLNYQWGTDGSGTPNGSISTAAASGVDGWEAQTQAGGAAVIYRVTAGEFKDFAARVMFTRDPGQAGNRAGQQNAAGKRTEVTPDATYVGSIYINPSRTQSMAAEITWLTSAGAAVGSRVVGTPTEVSGGTWARLVTGGVAPAGAEFAVVRAIDVAGPGWSVWLAGETYDLDGAMISLNEEFPYFDGDTVFDGDYVYEWEGTANASPSTRTPIDQVDPDDVVLFEGGDDRVASRALVDPDCTPVPAPPRPPTVPSDCIDDIGVWRRYYAQIPSNLVPDWLDVVPTLEVTSGAKAAHQVRIRYYANPDDLPPNQVNSNSWFSEQIVSFMPAKTVLTLDGVAQRVWAEVNSAQPISADHLLYGTKGKPATWPVLSCGISYLVSIEVPINEPAGNIEVAAFLTART